MSDKNEKKDNNRDQVIINVFLKHYRKGIDEVFFTMDDIRSEIEEVSRTNPDYKENNVADLRYQYTSGRAKLPEKIDKLGPWMISGKGKGNYAFSRLKEPPTIIIPHDLHAILLPDSTPEIVLEYAGKDEQGLLAKLRYNRILDVFLGINCYHLQNHWRTTIKNKGQCEIDDLYVGIDVDGRQYVIPVEAKSKKDNLSKTQIAQMIDFAKERYPRLIIKPIGIQEMKDNKIVLIEFTVGVSPDQIKIREIRQYKLVPMSECPINA